VFTARRTSELIKYAANAFLAMKITFINEIADLCEAVGANVQEVSRGIGLDGRIGAKFLHAGPGYGGSCFPKDTLALVKTAELYDSPLRLVSATVKIIAASGGSVQGKTIAVLGLTFKPNTDDMRDAPSLDIIPALQKAGARIKAYDPAGIEEAEKLLSGVEFVTGPYLAMEGADALVIITEWNEFRALDTDRIKASLSDPLIIDLRNIYDPAEMAGEGFRYVSVGRP
jgi:UDPglucose 6-dehydrogenase